MREKPQYIKEDCGRNLADFIWCVENEVGFRFKNFGGFTVMEYNKTIKVDALWLTYPNKKALRSYLLFLGPCSGYKRHTEELDEEEVLRDFSRFCMYKLDDISNILKKRVSLRNIHKILAPSPGKSDHPIIFNYRIKPFELTRQLALHFLRMRIFYDEKIEPSHIFIEGVSDMLSYKESIERACYLADEWSKFIPENANLETKILGYIAVAREVSVSTILKDVPKEYQRGFLLHAEQN